MTNGTLDWGIKEMPRFNATAYVLPGAFYGDCVTLMAEAGFTKADSIETADVVVFIGGADINPALYNEENVASSFSETRDNLEIAAFVKAQQLGKVCFGICRGAQFLWAMNGGSLWQDVTGHAGPSHYIIDIDEDVRVRATSLHHQAIRITDDGPDLEIVAVTEETVAKRMTSADGTFMTDETTMEIEAGATPATRCFFVQGHPEVGTKEYRSWTMTKLHDFYTEWTGGRNLPVVVPNQGVSQ